jgi:hypothetical protein
MPKPLPNSPPFNLPRRGNAPPFTTGENKMMNAEQMRAAIYATVKANGVPVTGDMFFALIFRTDSELRKICGELCINVKSA